MSTWALTFESIPPSRSPMRDVRLSPGKGQPSQDIQTFTTAELAATLERQRAVKPLLAEVTEFLSLTDLRWSELRALRVRDLKEVPFHAIRISRAHSDGYAEKGTKTDKTRVVPLTRRCVELSGQSIFTARRAAGLELALLDSDPMQIRALEETDHRVVELRVAGSSALTVAKIIKLEERLGGTRRDRILSKDAGDLLRLLRYCDAETIGHRLRELTLSEAAPVIDRATSFIRADISHAASNLVGLAVEDRSVSETEQQVAQTMRELSRRLLTAFDEPA